MQMCWPGCRQLAQLLSPKVNVNTDQLKHIVSWSMPYKQQNEAIFDVDNFQQLKLAQLHDTHWRAPATHLNASSLTLRNGPFTQFSQQSPHIP